MTKPFLVSPLDTIKTDHKIKTVLVHVEKQINDKEYLLSNGIFCVVGKIEIENIQFQINKYYVLEFTDLQMTKSRRFTGFTYLHFDILINENCKIYEIPSLLPSLTSIEYPPYFSKIIIIQEWIESLNQNNYDLTFQKIKESIFLDKESKMKTLARNICHTIYIRKNIVSLIAKLCIDISQIKPSFKEIFLQACNDLKLPENLILYFETCISNPDSYYIFEALHLVRYYLCDQRSILQEELI